MSFPDPAQTQPQEAPLFVANPADCQILWLQFVPPNQIRIEFSRQISRSTALKKLIPRTSAKRFVTLEPDPKGYHIWVVKPLRVGGASVSMTVVESILVPEVAELLLDNSVQRQAVLTREQWTAKAVRRYDAQKAAAEAWGLLKHASGMTFAQIMELDDGWYIINGWFIWRGVSQYGDHSHGFQDLELSRHETYNDDIKFFLNDGKDLIQAVRIQDEMWMENFRTMLAALANFYASAPGPGAKPKTQNKGSSRHPNLDRNSIDRAAKRVEQAQELAAQAYGTFNEIQAMWEHATESIANEELASQVNRDLDLIAGFLTTLELDTSAAED